MSPGLRSRQRGAIGLMAALTLGLALVFCTAGGRQRAAVSAKSASCKASPTWPRWKLSSAMAIAWPATNTATTYAGASAVRNGYIIPPANALDVRCGSLAPRRQPSGCFPQTPPRRDAIQVIASRPVLTSVAGGIWSMFNGGAYSLTTLLTAKAVAAPKILPPQAQLTIKSTLVTVDSSDSAALNLLFGKLLGGNLLLGVAGWQGLVDTNINLLQLPEPVGAERGRPGGQLR